MADAASGPKRRPKERVQDYDPPAGISPKPVFVWPAQPAALLRWLFAWPGYLWPWNIGYLAIALATWFWLTPDLSRMTTFEFGWIAAIFARNFLTIMLIYGLWHVRLYVQRAQGTDYKYNGRWQARDNELFLFKNQLLDNMFWMVVSAVPVWTGYEVLSLWLQANHYIPTVTWSEHPIYIVLVFLIIPFWRDLHFYLVHRLIHVPFLYRTVHKLHHKNTNPGPFSGLAMHPVEHVLYFSGVLLHWVLPSHPVHIIFHLQHLAFAPAQGHSGFDKVMANGKVVLENDHYMHYLHHKYFEVNYGGDGSVPVDKWFGTYHDGSEAAQETMNRRFLKANPPGE